MSRANFNAHTANVIDDFGLATHLDRFNSSYTALPAAATALAASNPTPTSGPTPSDLATEAVRDAFPLSQVAEALEREQALLAHLSENCSYYWMALWQALSPSQQATALTNVLPAGIVDPWPIGMVGSRLAFPIATYRVPGTQQLIDDLLPPPQDDDNSETRPTADVVLPTSAITVEARLGACDGCEEFIDSTRAVDIRTRKAEAARAEALADVDRAEADRRRGRLDKKPPDLSDPRPPEAELPLIRVQLENKGASPP